MKIEFEAETADGLYQQVKSWLAWADAVESLPFEGNGNGYAAVAKEAAHVGPTPKCAVCGGDVWDNRNDKRNPKAPDFKCKDKDCGHAAWIQKDGALKWDMKV